MRRPTAVLLGTLTGAVLMTAAKLGTPPLSGAETVAEAPLDRVTDPTSAPASGALLLDPSAKTVAAGVIELRMPMPAPTHNVAQDLDLSIADWSEVR